MCVHHSYTFVYTLFRFPTDILICGLLGLFPCLTHIKQSLEVHIVEETRPLDLNPKLSPS